MLFIFKKIIFFTTKKEIMKSKLNKFLPLSIFLLLGFINMVYAQIWVNYNENDGLIDGAIYGIVQDKDENLWFLLIMIIIFG